MAHPNKISQVLQGETSEELELPLLSAASPEQAGKGSLRSMWELLMQLRVLLPYLVRLVPLLDRGLLKAAPDLSEVRQGLSEVSAENKRLGSLLEEHSQKLGKVEEHLLQLNARGEENRKQIERLSEQMQSFSIWLKGLAALTALGFALLVAILVLQILHLHH
jgi:chromosome segregation ATPase